MEAPLTLIGLLACGAALPPEPCPPIPDCPTVPANPAAFAPIPSQPEKAEPEEVPPGVAGIQAALKEAVAFQDPDARVDVQSTQTNVVAFVSWNVGEGLASCALTYDLAGLASRSCNGIYASHSMGDGNQRFEYTVQERYAGKRIAVSGSLRTTLLKTGEHEDTALELANAAVVDEYFNPAPLLDNALVVAALAD